MALTSAGLLLAFALALISSFQLSTCHDVAVVVRGSVSCLHCTPHSNLSGIRVALTCSDRAKPSAVATTGDAGSFQTNLKLRPKEAAPLCAAELLGGPTQLYGFKKNLASKVVATPDKPNSYTISTPLIFYTACPLPGKDHASRCGSPATGASKTVDLPLPPEWGLAPSSYYFPFFPIIGIP